MERDKGLIFGLVIGGLLVYWWLSTQRGRSGKWLPLGKSFGNVIPFRGIYTPSGSSGSRSGGCGCSSGE